MEDKPYDIAIAACPSYESEDIKKSLSKVLDAIGGLDFVKPGMNIAIKANLVSAAAPEKATCTHPALIAELTRILTSLGAKVIVGDSPGGPFTESYLNIVYRISGMNVIESCGGDLNRNFSIEEISYPEAEVLKSFTCSSWLTEADAIICFSKLKTHGMMGLSANVKNMFGAIPGTMKPEYHYRFPNHDAFADMLVDINEYLKPVLYITDAIVGMEGNGPTAGKPRHIGALLASKRPYDLDVVCAKIIGLDPLKVPTIRASIRRELTTEKLGNEELDSKRPDAVSIYGNPDDFIVSDYDRIEIPNSLAFAGFFPTFLLPFVRTVLSSGPRVKENECIGCGKCAEICPASAIQMNDTKSHMTGKSSHATGKSSHVTGKSSHVTGKSSHVTGKSSHVTGKSSHVTGSKTHTTDKETHVTSKKPHITKKLCIRCFCCQEFCPVGAMKVHHSLVTRILQKR